MPDGFVWAWKNSFSLRVASGRLLDMFRDIDLGSAAEVAAVARAGVFIAVLTANHDLTLRRFDGSDVSRPCPSPVEHFTLDFDGRVTCA